MKNVWHSNKTYRAMSWSRIKSMKRIQSIKTNARWSPNIWVTRQNSKMGKIVQKKIKTRMFFLKKNLSNIPIIEVTKIKNWINGFASKKEKQKKEPEARPVENYSYWNTGHMGTSVRTTAGVVKPLRWTLASEKGHQKYLKRTTQELSKRAQNLMPWLLEPSPNSIEYT